MMPQPPTYRPDDGTIGWWRDRPCGACGHKARSHIGKPGYCCAYSAGDLYNSCHCNTFVETSGGHA